MKDYLKPYIEDEEIEIEDICNVSGGTRSVGVDDTDSGIIEDPVSDLWS
jgi:hypothetical protein